MNAFNRFRTMSLKQKFIMALLSCSLGSSIFVGLVMLTSTSSALERDLEEKFSAIVEAKAEEYHDGYLKLKTDMEDLSNSKFIQDALVAYESVAFGTGLDINADADLAGSPYFKGIQAKFNDTFNDYLKSYPLNSFAIALNGGSVVSQTGGMFLVGKNLVNGVAKGSSVGDCFSMAKQSGVIFTDLKTDFEKKPRAYLCSVIKSKYDRDGYKKDAPMGVMVADVKWEFFNRLAKFDAGLGQTGEIVLLSKEGTLKTFPREFAANASLDDLASEKWKQGVHTPKSRIFQAQNHSGDTVYRLQKNFELDDKNQWLIVAQQSSSEARAPIRNMQFWAIGLLALCAVAASVVGWFFSTNLTQKFSENSRRLTQANEDVVQVSEKVSSVATSVQTGSQQQSAAIHETSVSLEELTQMVARTAELSNNSKSKAERCESEAATGLEKIGGLLTSIEKVDGTSQLTLSQVDKANQSFQELLKIFNTITSKTQVINDIAFQTKLLSFNASVEAARAGEHGRGFSVVAEEVGKLAVSVSGAASEINSLLSNSSSKMNDMIDENRRGLQHAATEARQEIEVSKDIAAECNKFFESLAHLVREINRDVAQISSAAEEQTTGISEINRAVGQISMANDENTKNANVIFDLSHRLHSVVGELTHSNTQLEFLLQGGADEARLAPVAGSITPATQNDENIEKAS